MLGVGDLVHTFTVADLIVKARSGEPTLAGRQEAAVENDVGETTHALVNFVRHSAKKSRLALIGR